VVGAIGVKGNMFGYEELKVWDRAVSFAVLVRDSIDGFESTRKHFRLIEQLEAAVASVAMNIAEGKGRFSKKEFRQYCYIARGRCQMPGHCWKFSDEKTGYPPKLSIRFEARQLK
jgi:hypothetical protein